MKTILLLAALILSSFSALAQLSSYPADPNYCGRANSCHNGYFPLISSGTYYARATGRSCEEAMRRSEEAFLRAHGNMDHCGMVSGPYSWSCYRGANNRYVSWHQCNPDSGSSGGGGGQRRNCVLGGVWICGR